MARFRVPRCETDWLTRAWSRRRSTIEKEWGWVFFYRHTGEVRSTGTAYPSELYIAEYERELARR